MSDFIFKTLMDEKEKGRILGIRQAAAFVRRSHDEPTIVDEIIKYVIPHGTK